MRIHIHTISTSSPKSIATWGSGFKESQTEGHTPDLNQGSADLQSAALTTELCTQVHQLGRLGI